MQDRYLFRAKRIDNDEWAEGFYALIGKKHVIISEESECYYTEFIEERHGYEIIEVEPSTICQCTGINDKNGKPIWENDIIKCGEYITRVSWNEIYASWILTKSGWLYHHFFGESQNPEDCEAIGNIFDNPELLEQEG